MDLHRRIRRTSPFFSRFPVGRPGIEDPRCAAFPQPGSRPFLRGTTLSGLLGLAQHPETGVLYGINKTADPLSRELMTINAESGEATFVGFLDIHMAGLAFVFPVQASGDCDGSGALDAGDLACVQTVEERDAVLEALGSLPGDLDGNGTVDFNDFPRLANNFGQEPASYADGNIDLIGGVDFDDFTLFANRFGMTRADVAAVPEPDAAVPLACGGLLLLVCVRVRRR